MIYGLSERLIEKRRTSGLSQKQVAEMIGISQTMISQYERGERNPSLEVLVKLAVVYRCSIDYLLMGNEKASAEVSVEGIVDSQCG